LHKLDIFFIVAAILAGLGAILVYRHDHRKDRKAANKMIGICEIAEALGGKDTLRVNIKKDLEMDQLIRDGIPYEAYDHFKDKLKMTHHELCTFIGLKNIRALKNASARLSSISSDRLFRLARVYTLAVEVLADEDKGREWLKKPQYGLGGRIPLEMATTEIGAKEVENLLGRIEYSVLA
jgi:putative toxin-antitoxin system antitoxin component (TIGR02293 family)